MNEPPEAAHWSDPEIIGQAAMSPESGGPGPTEIAPVPETSAVLVSFPGTAPQGRASIAVRALLAAPHIVVLIALLIEAAAAVLAGWVAAIFAGQLPDWTHELLSAVLRWSVRVAAYLFLLTDSYPPFHFDDSDYPVRLFTRSTRLTRLAVLLRGFAVLPAALLAALASVGLLILAPFAWLIALVAGRLPAAWHDAIAAIIRFDARACGYAWMVTPDYPAGLLGDKRESPEGPWRLVLPAGASMLVKAGLIAGLAGLAGGVVTSVELTRPVSYPVQSKVEALYLLNQAWYAMPPAFLQIQSEEQSCHALACLTAGLGRSAQIVRTFIVGVREAGIPPPYTAEASMLIAAASRLADDLSRLAAIRSIAQGRAEVPRLLSDVNAAGNQCGAIYNQLSLDLIG
jgi:hypothetical protein